MSEIKRRNFLGLLGGAAVAGPKLAQGIADQVASTAPIGMPLGFGQTVASKGTDDWRVSRIAEIKKLLSGGKTEEQKERERIRHIGRMESVERMRLDGLRSVAGHHKVRMLIDTDAKRSDEMERGWASLELADLLKGTR